MSSRVLSLFAAAGLLSSGLTACGPDGETTPEEACKAFIAGDLVITEYMNDPDGTDTGNEWFEVYNATTKEVDLKGLVVFVAKSDGSKEKSHKVAAGKLKAGGYFVLGDSVASPLPEYVDYSYGTDLGAMPNEEGMIGLRCGKITVDETKYTVGGSSGVSQILGAKATANPDSASNDNEANFCGADVDQNAQFVADSYGSPGAQNAECPSVAPEGSCLDPVTGEYRDVVSPQPGDLVITEFMANPKGTATAPISDTSGEWFELYALAAVDLNGLVIGNAGTSVTKLNKAECMRIEAGKYALLARKTDPAINGALPATVAAFSVGLANTNGAISISAGEVLIDKVTYPSVKDGKSWQLDPAKLNATANDDMNSFCEATKQWAENTDFGTPGAANEPCPAPVDPNNCNDNGTSRPMVKPAAGDIVVTEYMADPKGATTAVSDTYGEWVELFVKRDVDLNGLQIKNEASGSMLIASPDCKRVLANTHIVLVRGLDSTTNGGIENAYAPLGFSMSNTGAHSIIVQLPADGAGPLVIDRIDYTAAALPGKAMQLDINKYDATQNDAAGAFCAATAAYGAGDLGTPGAANGACGQ